jgi:hypothetical protein
MPEDLVPWSQHKQKDVDIFIADNPSLPVVARGRGFALFDVRPLFVSRPVFSREETRQRR